MGEAVNHPAHYGGEDNPYETIQVLRAWMTAEQFDGWLHGTILKHLSRAGKKDDLLQDLRKAQWYLDYRIRWLKDKNNA